MVYSLERTLDETLTCITRTKYFGGVEITAKAVDPHTVVFTTATPMPILPTLMAQVAISSVNTPKGEYTADPIGTGPYEFDSWTQGQDVKLSRFDGYWGEAPEIENATYVWRTDSSVAAAMVETGEADLALSIAPQDATNPATDKVYPNSETAMFRLSADIPPINDVRVRKAINLAIDRQAFLGSIISDQAELAEQQVGPSVLGHNPDLKPWPYDPEQAKALLAEAKADGVPVETEIRMIGRPAMFAGSNEFVEAAAEMLRDVGLQRQAPDPRDDPVAGDGEQALRGRTARRTSSCPCTTTTAATRSSPCSSSTPATAGSRAARRQARQPDRTGAARPRATSAPSSIRRRSA